MKRPRKRYLGGVCEALGNNNKIATIMIRIMFLVLTFFLYFPFLVYIILCFTIKNYQKVELKRKIKYQFIGFLVGGVSGHIVMLFILKINSVLAKGILTTLFMGGGIIIVLLVIIMSIFWALFGLIIGRSIVERKESNKTIIPII